MGANHSEHAKNNDASTHDTHHLQHSDSLSTKHFSAEHNKQHEEFRFSESHDLPVIKRKCTDIIFLLIWILFVTGVAIIVGTSVVKAGPGGLLRMTNGLQLDGQVCGYDSPRFGTGSKYKYLWYYNVLPTGSAGLDTSLAICVDKCPTDMTPYACGLVWDQEQQAALEATPVDKPESTEFPGHAAPALGFPDPIPSGDLFGRVTGGVTPVNYGKKEFCQSMINAPFNTRPLVDGVINVCVPVVDGIAAVEVPGAGMSVGQIIADFRHTAWVLGACVGIAIGLALIFLGIIRIGGRCLVYLFLILAAGIFGVLGAVTFMYQAYGAKNVYALEDPQMCGVESAIDPATGAAASKPNPSATYLNMMGHNVTCTCNHDQYPPTCTSTELTAMFVSSIILWVIGGIVVVVMLFMGHSLRVASAIVSEAGHVLGDQKQMFVLPLYKFILIAGFLGIWLTSLMSILAGTPNVNTSTAGGYESVAGGIVSSPAYTVNVHTLQVEWGIIIYHVFFLLWTLQLIKASMDFIIGVIVSGWYFADLQGDTRTPKYKWPLCHGIFMVFRYHLGSLALGSFLVALIQLVRLIVEYIDHKTKAAQDTNKCAKAVMCMCKCCLWCFECCMKFITRQTYLMMAIVGENFCFSAKKMFFFSLRNIKKVGVTHGVASVILFFGKIVVVGITTLFCFLIVTMDESLLALGVQPIFPCLACALVSFIIAGVILKLYSTTIEAMLMCFMVDDEKNNGKTSHAPSSLRACLDDHADKEAEMASVQPRGSALVGSAELKYEESSV